MTNETGASGDHSSPAVDAYLSALDRALQHADPRERAEVIAGISEHIDQALPVEATEADVARVLYGLGSVESIAAGVSTEPPAGIDQLAAIAAVAPWVLPTVYGLTVASLVFVLVPFVSVFLAGAALVIARRWWRSTGAMPVKTAVVVSSIALGFSILVLLLIVILFAGSLGLFMPATSVSG